MDYISQINSAENDFVYVIILVLPIFGVSITHPSLKQTTWEFRGVRIALAKACVCKDLGILL